MNKEKMQQAANQLFATTAHEVLWANPKGEFFTSENIGSLSLKKDEKLTKFERNEKPSESKEVTLNATKTIEAIENVETLEALKVFEADERKTVKEAFAKKEAELIQAIKVAKAQTGTGAPVE